MSVYGLPARRREEDRCWFYGGLASCQDTNRPKSEFLPFPEYSAPLRATRAQRLNLSMSIGFDAVVGKPAGMRDDEAIRGVKAWYRIVNGCNALPAVPQFTMCYEILYNYYYLKK
ncbi:hypothetical protein BU17DRAFT_70824 [Hysterangium stoloniferum]|nr:hypothetical protein BU17DRAFT_70824 [Hysterangium stoloniferum]